MKVPLSWLRDYVDVDLAPQELASRLTFAGLEVDGVRFVGLPAPKGTRKGSKISSFAWDPKKVVVGELVEVRPHPQADRLVLALVEDGSGVQTTVAGAPNLFGYRGQGPLARRPKVAFAREGARLLDPREKSPKVRKLKRTKLRGVESAGMVCSEKELGISDAHEGIIVLDDDSVEPGTPLADRLGDVVFDIAITPNMARNASVLGVAREIAALTGKELRHPSYEAEMTGPAVERKIRIEIREPALNPRFTATLLEGVEIGPSPYWMQLRLVLAGMRPINNIVDVTNYVMLEIGQPLHAFDYDVLAARAGGSTVPTIITRPPQPGETLVTLDEVERKDLDEFTLLVADTRGGLSIAGVMGGLESEVSETTTNVLLESAAWDFIAIRRTVLAHRFESEAGYRFSRGVHPGLAPLANLRGIELMRRLAGGVVYRGMVDEYPAPPRIDPVDLPLSEIERLLGITIPKDEVRKILEALEFGVKDAGDSLEVTVPEHRLDIGQGVTGRADLVEEISRIWGYERITETQIADAIPPQRGNPALDFEETLKDALVSMGLQEVVTYRLTSPEREAKLSGPGAPADGGPYLALANPITEERRVLRRELLPSVLEVAAANARHAEGVALFEIGKVYLPVAGEQLPEEPSRLAIVVAGVDHPRHWSGQEGGAFDFFALKGIVEMLADELHLSEVAIAPADHPSFIGGRCAALSVGGLEIGILGELHPEVRAAYELPFAAILAADLSVEDLSSVTPDRFSSRPIGLYPPVVEDIAVVIADAVAAADVRAAIQEGGGDLLRDIELFDVYRGPQVGAGQKSLAYRLTYQADDRTLTDKEVARRRRAIVELLESRLDGRLRD